VFHKEQQLSDHTKSHTKLSQLSTEVKSRDTVWYRPWICMV